MELEGSLSCSQDPPPVPILSKFNQINTPTLLPQIHFSIVLPCTHMSSWFILWWQAFIQLINMENKILNFQFNYDVNNNCHTYCSVRWYWKLPAECVGHLFSQWLSSCMLFFYLAN
jgi:hypothetical protein